MASSAPASGGGPSPSGRRQPLGFLKAVVARKQNFIQLFVMTGILLLSAKSLSQKYRIHELTEEIVSLEEEQKSLESRMNRIKQSLLAEAAAEPTGAFATRLRLLFGDESN
ncbi:hypothetical protein F511_18197 [Dorcoceras hygrometricum]|uniref:Uncharacterized protein n=1 Tax=Dorcoceras hygrometricum TaxID=472368 RepID=A0A2Z7BML1_9LAMI|nr:hypothetical protein F511_18197 [Dorcoceras hygrometricum]